MLFPSSPKKAYEMGSVSIVPVTLLYVKTRPFLLTTYIGQSFHFMATSAQHLVPIRSAISQR